MKQLIIILCLCIHSLHAMNAEGEEEDLNVLLQRYTEMIEDVGHHSEHKQEDFHSSDELLTIYQKLLDSPPLYPESASDTLSAPSKPTYIINLRPEQPPAAAVPQIPAIQPKQVPTKLLTRSSVYTCKACRKKLPDLDNLHLHYAQEHPDLETFNCEICTEPYIKIDSLRKHRKRTHNLRFNRSNFLNQLSSNE